jgi:hypothetical protein
MLLNTVLPVIVLVNAIAALVGNVDCVKLPFISPSAKVTLPKPHDQLNDHGSPKGNERDPPLFFTRYSSSSSTPDDEDNSLNDVDYRVPPVVIRNHDSVILGEDNVDDVTQVRVSTR